MAKDHDFKRLVRARMQDTGECYTEARTALAARRDAGELAVSDRTRSLLGQLADTGLAAVSRDHLARLPEPERRAAAIEGLRHETGGYAGPAPCYWTGSTSPRSRQRP